MKIRLSRSIVPNLFTVLNIFFGFMCMIHALQGKYVLAAWYVILSAICDSLDGFMARLTHSASEFGVELDSLADVVSFGVAPSFLLYSLVLHDYGAFGALVAALPLILGALRLARFNVQLVGFSKEYFTGMPIPLSALTLISYVLFFHPQEVVASEQLRIGLIALTVACGILMVSTIRYPVIPRISIGAFREKPFAMSAFAIGALAVLVSLGKLLFPVLMLVMISGPFFATGRLIRRGHARYYSVSDDNDDEHHITADSN
ncbi:MAG: CDP-diacylglycerol--serine O-phosphatidyltransferase [Bacteroidia bacterium]|nr:CDP-diacylglycerol--serine O-phosphatidyltransferase [Bacteroidia bacterium]